MYRETVIHVTIDSWNKSDTTTELDVSDFLQLSLVTEKYNGDSPLTDLKHVTWGSGLCIYGLVFVCSSDDHTYVGYDVTSLSGTSKLCVCEFVQF